MSVVIFICVVVVLLVIALRMAGSKDSDCQQAACALVGIIIGMFVGAGLVASETPSTPRPNPVKIQLGSDWSGSLAVAIRNNPTVEEYVALLEHSPKPGSGVLWVPLEWGQVGGKSATVRWETTPLVPKDKNGEWQGGATFAQVTLSVALNQPVHTHVQI